VERRATVFSGGPVCPCRLDELAENSPVGLVFFRMPLHSNGKVHSGALDGLNNPVGGHRGHPQIVREGVNRLVVIDGNGYFWF